jgi:hypothetical protein
VPADPVRVDFLRFNGVSLLVGALQKTDPGVREQALWLLCAIACDNGASGRLLASRARLMVPEQRTFARCSGNSTDFRICCPCSAASRTLCSARQPAP